MLAAAVALSSGLTLAGLPAAVLIGSMLAALALGRGLHLPKAPFVLAQTMIGTMIGSAMTLPLVQAFLGHWLLVSCTAGATLALSLLIGAVVGRTAGLDRMTALWSSIPGLASGVVVMSASFGASPGIVAVGQYIRVVLVAVLAAVASAVLLGDTPLTALPHPETGWSGALVFLAVAVVCALVSHNFSIPGLNMILPMTLAAALQLSGMAVVESWPPLMLAAFAVVGLRVGVGFDTEQLRLALGALPHFAAGALALVVICGLISLPVGYLAGVDPITAFLATIPGGLDAVAIVAATSGADLPFVMLFQTARFVIALFIGVPLVRHLTRSMAQPAPAAAAGKRR